ncbi:centrosomal protein of 57 kDa-like isoform X2 [Haliotis rubra]|uniref:centrosomal protein of 57 kDa-like isoform X2 n=1 Tax=Haliotis rubra TaxID=36100 RepID=UPI001EE4F556|nr:centrosomal protein of 57 kDa-like isoform X2 [Haliotis rubra]
MDDSNSKEAMSTSQKFPMSPGPPYDTSIQDNSISLTQYHEYPSTHPFINTEFRRAAGKLSSSYPENNRDAVVSALRNLQEKVQKLELERSAAENNLKSLASETSRYKDMLQGEQETKDATTILVSRQTKELGSQLSAAETKCDVLEKQLDYMRKMVHNVERDRLDTVARNVVVEQQREEVLPRKFKIQAERISELEREHLKLTATQNLAESKIRELEDKLRDERLNRRMTQQRAAERETEAAAQRVYLAAESNGRPPVKAKKPTKKKKKKVVPKKTSNNTTRKAEPSKHYRLNLAEIPFVAGRATTPSHSVGANVQRVLAWMKTHSTALCSEHYQNGDIPRTESASSSSSSNSLDNDLSDILLALQDEFGQLSCEHQELVKQINEVADHRAREDMERELDSLIVKMDVKGQQISKVRQHQQKVEDMKRKIKTKKSKDAPPPTRPQSAMASFPARRTCDSSHSNSKPKTQCCTSQASRQHTASSRQVSLDVLKDMKKLQTTLRKDDLCWE